MFPSYVSGLPIELLDLVMGYLDPWDLLHLSRVSTGFRDILITSRAESLWKRSIQSVGMPRCPDGVSEPTYIAFVFDSEYCVCGNSPAPLLIPQLKLRLCAKCKSRDVQWYNPRTVGKLVTPSTLGVIAPNLVTPFSLGNDDELKAFYVPELNSNALRVSEAGCDTSIAVNQILKAAASAQSFSQSLWEWCLERQRIRAFSQLVSLGFSRDLLCGEWPAMEQQQFDQAVLMGVRDWSDQYWNENVVPRLLPIFRSVQQQVEGKARRGVVETRKQESAERSAQLIEPLPDNTVPRRALEDNDQTPTAPETLSSVRDELAILVDRELAPNHSTMANSFRSVHQGILSPDMSAVSDREFLEKVVTMFACKSCKAVYDYKAHANHGTECVKAIRARSLGSKSSGPVGRHAVLLALHLLQLFGLPEDSTRALVEEMFCETKFVCLCGNPKFRKQVGFFELLQHLISENEAHEEAKGRARLRADSPKDAAGTADVSLINDHDLSLLPSLVRRVDPGQPRWKFETRSIDCRSAAAYCESCFQLTGVRKFLGGDKEYMVYHMEAKHGLKIV